MLLGDSLTECGDWPRLLGGRAVANYGYSGFTSRELLPIARELAERRPRAVFILSGTNDIRDGLPPAESAADLERLVDVFARRSPTTTVVVQAILPRADAATEVVRANEAIEAMARGRNIRFLDMCADFDDGCGGLRREETTDGIHLADAGYRRWAGHLETEWALLDAERADAHRAIPHHRTTVIVASRHRPAGVSATVASLLANRDTDFHVVVIDQSQDTATADALAPYAADGRFTYQSTDLEGKTRALNRAVEMTRSSFVLCTDDDCVVSRDWVAGMADVLARQGVGAVFCAVEAGPHDPEAGFVPTFSVERERTWSSLWRGRHLGIGAGMGVRRDVIEAIGGFDEFLGPGGRFPSADDGDLALRVLAAGWSVVDTPEPSVVHHGFRTWDEGVGLTRRDFSAIGAQHGKALRCGVWQVVPSIFAVSIRQCIVRPLVRATRLRRRPEGMGRSIHYWRGFLAGVRHDVDREHVLFS